jgi:hypothetical protein
MKVVSQMLGGGSGGGGDIGASINGLVRLDSSIFFLGRIRALQGV